MDDSARMGFLQGQGQLAHQKCSLSLRERPGADVLRQRLTLDEDHRQIGEAVHLTDVVDGANVGMPQGSYRPCLAIEACQDLRVVAALQQRDLQRHGAIELAVVGQVHRAHAALAENLEDAIASKGCG